MQVKSKKREKMWRINIIVNNFILFGCYLIGAVAVTPAYNHFVQYADGVSPENLPVLTATICSIRFSGIIIPVLWLMFSLIFMIRLKNRQGPVLNQWVQLHTSVSILSGIIIVFVYSLAGILPFLKIGGLI